MFRSEGVLVSANGSRQYLTLADVHARYGGAFSLWTLRERARRGEIPHLRHPAARRSCSAKTGSTHGTMVPRLSGASSDAAGRPQAGSSGPFQGRRSDGLCARLCTRVPPNRITKPSDVGRTIRCDHDRPSRHHPTLGAGRGGLMRIGLPTVYPHRLESGAHPHMDFFGGHRDEPTHRDT